MTFEKVNYTYEVVEGWGRGEDGFELGVVLGVATDSENRVYVCQRDATPIDLGYDPDRHFTPGVAIFDQRGRFLTFWGDELFPGSDGLGAPHGIWISAEEKVYIADKGNHTVRIFTVEGKLLQTIGLPNQPSDTGYDGKNRNSITRSAPPFNQPTAAMKGPSGAIYVSDGYGNARIHKFSPEGELILSWGEPGKGPGQFDLPHHVWVDNEENVYVADRMNHRIQIFDGEGRFITQWTNITRPQEIFIDSEDMVFVTETAQRITIMRKDDTVLTRWGEKGTEPGQFCHNTHAMCQDSHGDLYIAVGRAVNDLQKFTRNTKNQSWQSQT